MKTFPMLSCLKGQNLWNDCSSNRRYHSFARKCLLPRLGVPHRQKLVQWLHNLPLKLNERLLKVLNRMPLWSMLDEQFLWFSKNYLLRFHCIFLLLLHNQTFVFQTFLLRGVKAYQCPKWLIMMEWILVSVALKKWCFFFDAQCS